MSEQIPLTSNAVADFGDSESHSAREVAPDIAYQRLLMVNVVFVGAVGAGDRGWTLIDTGLFGSASAIRNAAAERFGQGSRPHSIILTHGHFDHVGALTTLSKEWDTPIFAHPLERPYLDGRSSYPPGDPSVGGGLVASLSRFYPRGPIDVSLKLQDLPRNGELPGMPGWRWLHTPGHSAGHVSLWRESDRSLIVGDAFVTTGQESVYAVATQRSEMHGPPAYFTVDWNAAQSSVRLLAGLKPELVITGHGEPMKGFEMRNALHQLAENFATIAVPPVGRYVSHPARVEDGTAYC